MVMCKPIFLITSLLWMWAIFANAQNQTSPNCPFRCGDVSIPYPFGMGDGCYKDKGFEITCNFTNGAFRPFLGSVGPEVIGISTNKVIVKSISTVKCYNTSSGEGQRGSIDDRTIGVGQGPYTFSSTQNKLYAVGCDIVATVTEYETQKYVTGCVSRCIDGNTAIINGSCSGFGCCEAAIPKGIKSLSLRVDSINTRTRSWAANNGSCSFAGLLNGPITLNGLIPFNNENYTAQMINSTMQRLSRNISIAMDWAIENKTCDVALSTGWACQAEKSGCLDSTNGPGYQCVCLAGYQGNPYIRDGCQDIDECEGPNNCIQGARCVNTDGSYGCACPVGTLGEGTKYGIGCLPSSDNNKSRIGVVFIGVSASAGVLALVAVGFWLYREYIRSKHSKLKQKFYKRNGGLLLEQRVCSSEGSIEKTKIFVTEDLRKATDNFNEGRILGRGGSGTVYKGMLSDGRIVAIKKSKVVDESQIGQFINELVILSQINHRSIVKLFGCCLETEVPLLAYEFISNGTLSYHLHDEEHKSSISWEDRLRIAIEIAGALSYLHSSVSTPIFHRDVKSSNILLDESYRAKISDFGISRSVPYEQTHLTTLVQGTFGYLDPEYFHSSQFTDKSDVYSFGVVLVELLTGEKPISFGRSEEEKNLVMHFMSSVKENRLSEILETRVLNEGGKEELMVVAKLAKRCLKLVGKKRPTMKEVSTKLEGLRKFPGEETDQKNSQETRYWLYDSFPCFPSDLENEDTKMMPCATE